MDYSNVMCGASRRLCGVWLVLLLSALVGHCNVAPGTTSTPTGATLAADGANLTLVVESIKTSSAYYTRFSMSEQADILVAWSKTWRYTPPDINATWLPGTDPCSTTWAYVSCSGAQNVTKLDLSNLGIVGPLSPSLARLFAMQSIDLSNNQFYGSLPSEWGVPGFFLNLQKLSLAHNQLDGPLPSSWGTIGTFPKLQWLDLSENFINGQLPSKWVDSRVLQSLAVLSLAKNEISGALPALWGLPGGWANLTSLNVSMNLLSGGLPPAWASEGALKSLKTLDLSGNDLSGALPVAWANRTAFPKLSWLGLAGNWLGDEAAPGPLPQSWASVVAFPKLKTLALFPMNPYIVPANGTNSVVPLGFKPSFKVVDMDGDAASSGPLCSVVYSGPFDLLPLVPGNATSSSGSGSGSSSGSGSGSGGGKGGKGAGGATSSSG